MNIYEKINQIRQEANVAYIKKDKDVANRYKAVTHDAVTAFTREAFIKHGVVCIPNIVKSAMINTGMFTKGEAPIWRYEATYEFRFVSTTEASDGTEKQESFTVLIEAHALDEGDKAPGKALSYAKKYAVLKLLDIETGEDDEGRVEAHGALPQEVVAKYEKQIEDAKDAETLTKVWQAAVAECREAKDLENYDKLKTLVAARGKQIKK